MKKYFRDFLLAVMAGICIGLGATVFLRLKDAFPGGQVPGTLLFTIGLFAICTRGYNLFTGKACALFDNKPDYVIFLLVVWVGNLVGTMLLGGLQNLTAVCGDSGINATAHALVEAKMGTSYLSLFVLGFICNIFIYLAVNGYANNPHELGKYLSLFLGVSIFILTGTEHSVADMYYWAVSGMLYEQFGHSLLCLVVISLGNVCGGVFFPLLEKACKKLAQN